MDAETKKIQDLLRQCVEDFEGPEEFPRSAFWLECRKAGIEIPADFSRALEWEEKHGLRTLTKKLIKAKRGGIPTLTRKKSGRPQNPNGPRKSLTISLPHALREKLDRLGERLTRETGEAHGTSKTIQRLIEDAVL